jgi:hypothetical protein
VIKVVVGRYKFIVGVLGMVGVWERVWGALSVISRADEWISIHMRTFAAGRETFVV